MGFEDVKKIWMNGKLVDFADAKIHVFTHALHYGSGVFEGDPLLQHDRAAPRSSGSTTTSTASSGPRRSTGW